MKKIFSKDEKLNENAELPPVEPLITAAEAYPTLERAVLGARRIAAFSFRVFDARARLQTQEARSFAGGDDWASLIAATAAKGVKVRIQMSDFDPIGGAALHAAAWASLARLDEAVAATPGTAGAVEAMAARHEAELGLFWRMIFAPRARREAATLSRADGTEGPALRSVTSGAFPRLFPATHHQKIAVVDDDFAMIGGLDVDERRWDAPDHDRPAEETWRDVSLAIRGGEARAVARVAAGIWNRCAPAWRARGDEIETLEALGKPTRWEVDAAEEPASSVRVTASKPADGPFAFAPRTVRRETEDTVLALIAEAKRHLYVETQFFRARRIADALAEAARSRPELELTMILPFAPERYAFEGRRDTAMRHGEALQLHAVETVADAFGDRAAILSPAKPGRADRDDAFTAFGAGVVYVHSKVLIVDGRAALVGSANLNGRSLRWDTEASYLWRADLAVGAFLRRLAESWLGEAPETATSVEPWRSAAAENAAKTPAERDGFLLPHDMRRARRFARRAFWLPDDLF